MRFPTLRALLLVSLPVATAAAEPTLADVAAKVRSGNEAAALATLDAIAADARADVAGRYLEARLLERVGRLDDARAAFTALDVDALPRALRDEARFRRARLATRTGHCDAVTRDLDALASRPGDLGANAHALLAECALGHGDAAGALRTLDALGSPRSLDPVALASLASVALERLGRPSDAALRLRAAYLAHPEHPDAPRILEAIARLDPDRAARTLDERLRVVELLIGAREHERALAELDGAAVTDESARAAIAHARGTVLFAMRRYADAVVALDAAITARAATKIDDRFLAARAAWRAGNDADAIARFESFAADYPDEPRAAEALYSAASIALDAGDASTMRAFVDTRTGRAERAFRAEGAFALALRELAGDDRRAASGDLGVACARPRDEAERASCRYFVAVAGIETDREASIAAFRALADEGPHAFYGLFSRLRLARLGIGYVVAPEPERAGGDAPIVLAAEVSFLAALGLVDEAADALEPYEESWNARSGGDRALLAAYLALDAPGRAFRIARARERTAAPEDRRAILDALHPRPFAEELEPLARRVGVDPFYVYATMRQESGFRADAVSRVGALGILQMMPATAARIAMREGDADFEPTMLFSPRTSVRLALVEMSTLGRHYRGCTPLVAAGYNAGTAKVDQWLRDRARWPIDLFFESIPFDETRGYVRRVMGHVARYHALNGHPDTGPTLIDDCADVVPRLR